MKIYERYKDKGRKQTQMWAGINNIEQNENESFQPEFD